MVWGGGILAEWGVKDFAGGIVVHNIAGIAALASVLYVGKRKVDDRGPHSIPLVALGTGLLWFGWYGFNAGIGVPRGLDDRRRVSQHRHRGIVRGDRRGWPWIGAYRRSRSFSACSRAPSPVWRPMTPAAGYVSPGTAALIGFIAGVVCYYAVRAEESHGVGRRPRRVGRARRGWLPRHRAAGRVRVDGVERGVNGGVDGLLARQSALFLRAARRDGVLERVGVRVHARNAVADRSGHAGPCGRRP